MSHSINAIKNKNQKQPQVDFRQYLYNSGEPTIDLGYTMSPKIRAKLEAQSNKYYVVMRRQVRRNAQRLRTRYL